MKPSPAFFVTGGTLRPDALCYVERQADRDLHHSLLNAQFCYVLTPRQMGKSSLMVRSVVRLRREGFKVAVLDLTSIGQNLTPEQWYDGLIGRLGQQLELEDELLDHWRAHSRWGPLQRWISAIEWVLVAQADRRLVIFIDEIDTVRSLPFSTDEFFAAIRECYNRRAQDPRFDRLTFGLLGVAAPTDLIRDPRLTPFNIGRRIELHDFTEAESLPLAQGLSANHTTGRTLLRRVLFWTGGQPFLTQRLCQSVVDVVHPTHSDDAPPSSGAVPPLLPSPQIVDQVCSRLFLEPSARERDDNLVFVRQRILRSDTDVAALLALYRSVRRGRKIPDNERDPLVCVLKLSGLTTGHAGALHVRNRIYQAAFNEDWIHNNMPEAETRRQRKAFHRGVFIAFATMFALAAIALGLLVNSLRLNPLGLKATLPDGSLLTLDTVSFGSQHHYEPGRWRSAWLPRSFSAAGRSIPKPSFDLETPTEALTFWMTRQDSNSGAYLNFDWWSHFELVDSHGCTFFGNSRTIRHDRNATGSYDATNLTPLAPTDASFIVASGAAHSFPRREKSFRLRLYNLDQHPVAEFNIPNPAYRTYPVWRPEPLPQTRREQDLTITLTEVQTLIAAYDWNGSRIDLPVTRLTWQAFWNGTLSTQWEPDSLTLRDATGNATSLLPLFPEPGLCTHEAAWSVKAILYQTPEAAAENLSDTWPLGDLNRPAPSHIENQQQTRSLGGLTVQFRGIAGPGRFRIEQGHVISQKSSPSEQNLIGDSWFSFSRGESPLARLNPIIIVAGKPFLILHIDNQGAPPARLGFSAVNQHGRPIQAEEHREGNLYFLALPSQVDKLHDARLWVRPPRQFDFIVRPPHTVRTTDRFEQFSNYRTQQKPFAPRDPTTPRQLIDLTPHFNASLLDDWHRQVTGNDLARLPQGVQRLGNVDFDIRGIVQLAGTEARAQRFPRQVKGIRIEHACNQLHFLHASGWNANRGAFVGQYVVRFADGSLEAIPLVFGRNIEDWWFSPEDPAPVPEAEVVWTSANRASLSLDRGTRLYKCSWTNPRPAMPIQSIDFLSGMSDTAPFLIAITAE